MDSFFDPKGKQGCNQLMFFYQEPEDKGDQHGKATLTNPRYKIDIVYALKFLLFLGLKPRIGVIWSVSLLFDIRTSFFCESKN